MRKIDKKQFSNIVEKSILEAGKKISNINFASQTADIINNEEDFEILLNFVSGKTIPILLERNEVKLKYTLLASLQEALYRTEPNSELLSNDLIEIFDNDCTKAFYNEQLNFAMNQFCVAFYQYAYMKEKYPDLIKSFEI
jgi:hypothetical protein